MKLKYLLTAMAVPALLVACSQDEFESLPDNNNQALLGKVAGKVSFDVTDSFSADTRISWGTTGDAGVVKGDEMSLFWVGTEGNLNQGAGDAFKSAANALYKENNGFFESQNIVYVGKHIIVFPVDTKHYTDRLIEVSTGAEQDGNVEFGKRAIFVSDLIDIVEPVEEPVDGTNYAGYGKTVTARVSPLTSQLAFNLKFNLPEKISEVIVKKVVISSDEAIFATKANLANVTTSGGDHIGIANAVYGNSLALNMPTGTKITKEDNTLLAQIAMLPVDLADTKANATYEITVVTNYGNVTINKAKSVTNKDGEYQCADGTDQENVTETTPLSFAKEFGLTSKYSDGANEAAPAAGAKDKRSWGKRILRNVAVNMSEASIDDMAIADSEELIAAYDTYKLLGKAGAVNFVLTPGTAPFTFTPEALAAMNETAVKDVTLSFADACTGLELNGAFAAIPDFGAKITSLSTKPVILGENSNGWSIDVKNAKAANQFSEIKVNGKLTLTESATTASDEEVLAKNITSKAGEVNVASNVTIPASVVYSAENVTVGAEISKATTNVTAGTLTLSTAGTIAGNVTIAQGARIVVSAASTGVTFSGDVTLNGSLLQTTDGVLNIGNGGVVTMGEKGSLIATANAGKIVLNKRNQNVTVNTPGDIQWTYNGEKTFVKEATDAFNHLVVSEDIDLSGIAVADDATDPSLTTLEIEEGAWVEVTARGASDTTVKIANVIVNAGATMQIPTASEIVATATQVNGDIEVYGDYTEGTKTGNGNIFKY